jgi:hypothetical protein
MYKILIPLIWLVALVFTINRIFKRTDIELNTKLLWTILIIIAPFIGLLIYYLVGEKRPDDLNKH